MSEKLTAVTVPKWGIEMQEGTLTQWLVDAGQTVARAQPLAEFETDKIVNELEAPAAGVLLKRLAEVDSTLAVGSLIGVIGAADTPEADLAAFIANFKPADTSFERGEPSTAPAAPTELAAGATSNPSANQAAAPVNPVVRRLAAQLGVDLARVQGTGERGRITKEDVQAAAQRGNEPNKASPAVPSDLGAYEVVALSATRKHIAEHLGTAKPGIPHFYLERSVCVDTLLAHCNAAEHTSFNAALMYLVTLSLREHPELNGRFENGELRRYHDVNIATAVAAERGLITPVVKGAQGMSDNVFAQALRAQIDKAKQGKLSADDVAEATFTVSNLGMMGIDRFTAIINPPQLAILAVGANRSVLCRQGEQIVNRQVMSVTLSCDHRVIDGAVGAQFLLTLAKRIENADFSPPAA